MANKGNIAELPLRGLSARKRVVLESHPDPSIELKNLNMIIFANSSLEAGKSKSFSGILANKAKLGQI